MKTTLLGLFGDYELARMARAKLLVSEFPIDRIMLAAVQGPGQSRVPAIPRPEITFGLAPRAVYPDVIPRAPNTWPIGLNAGLPRSRRVRTIPAAGGPAWRRCSEDLERSMWYANSPCP